MASINWGALNFTPSPTDGPPPLNMTFYHPNDNHMVRISPQWKENTSQVDYEAFCLNIIDSMEGIGYNLSLVTREHLAYQSLSYTPGP